MKAHPLADFLPMLDDEALRSLGADIKEHGQQEPIVLLDGLILDGRNRFRACELVGVKPTFATFTASDAVAFVASKNLYRRHLNESQRAMVAAQLVEIYEQEKRASIEAGPVEGGVRRASIEAALRLGGSGRIADRAGALLNVSGSSTERAKQVLKDGVPEVVDAVRRGELGVTAAATIARRSPEEQRRALASPPTSTRRPAFAPAVPPTDFVPSPVDEELKAAARLCDRLVSLTNEICTASPRVKRALANELALCLPRLSRLVQGAA